MKLEKARIYPVKKKNNAFYVQFNPNTLQYRVNQSSSHEKHGTDSAPKQSDPTGASGRAELSMTLFFYSFRSETDYSDVRKNINSLRPYLGRRADQAFVRGEDIGFAWGTIVVEGYLESMDVSYQMFAADGTPVQAEVQITIIGEDPEVKAQGINHVKREKYEQDSKVSWNGSDPAETNQDIAWMYGGECGN